MAEVDPMTKSINELYSPEFIEKFGMSNPRWSKMSPKSKEELLRHQHVCVLLINTEMLTQTKRIHDMELYNISKRAKIDLSSGSSSGVQSSDEVIDIQMEKESKYRYILIEGDTMGDHSQNSLCSHYGIPKLDKRYDIFDKSEKRFIEVKVTKVEDSYIQTISDYILNDKYCSLVLVNPLNFDIQHFYKRDDMPGVSKVVNWLSTRSNTLMVNNVLEMMDDSDQPLYKAIFKNIDLMNSIKEWVDKFYAFKDKPFEELLNTDDSDMITISAKRLNSNIEDVKERNAPFMKYTAKMLPPFIKESITTTEHLDASMNTLIMGNKFFSINEEDEPFCIFINWIADEWKRRDNDFFFVNKTFTRDDLWILGINVKNTVAYDNEESLEQEEFREPPKLKYSKWLSNMMMRLSKKTNNNTVYFKGLTEEEVLYDNPMEKTLRPIVNQLMDNYSKTEVAKMSSEIKNVYSRIGGAYNVSRKKKNKMEIVMFPIYSTGDRQGITTREVTGVIIRGPCHPRRPTDRIPIVTLEKLNMDEEAYFPYINKPIFLVDEHGNKWCMRQNSVMKNDPPFLAFSNNPVFISANMMGEILFNLPYTQTTNIKHFSNDLINSYCEWTMERIVEGIMMMILGGSCEEGAMAAVRKIFMLMVSWSRGKAVWGWEEQGLADSLNECLLDRPLALYWSVQIKMFLSMLDN
jgi:hypothetical protein